MKGVRVLLLSLSRAASARLLSPRPLPIAVHIAALCTGALMGLVMVLRPPERPAVAAGWAAIAALFWLYVREVRSARAALRRIVEQGQKALPAGPFFTARAHSVHKLAEAYLAIDRGALTCVGKTAALAALGELRRVLVPGGRLLFNPYSSTHTSAEQSRPGPDGTRVEISAGTLQGVGHLACWDEAEVRDAAAAGGWTLRQLAHFSQRDADGGDEHSEWRAVLERA